MRSDIKVHKVPSEQQIRRNIALMRKVLDRADNAIKPENISEAYKQLTGKDVHGHELEAATATLSFFGGQVYDMLAGLHDGEVHPGIFQGAVSEDWIENMEGLYE